MKPVEISEIKTQDLQKAFFRTSFALSPKFTSSSLLPTQDLQTTLFNVVYSSVIQEMVPEPTEEKDNPLGDVVEEEMAATSQAVEAAALRIQEMLQKSRKDDKGVKLEVNERILDSCTGLMNAIKVLILRAKELQTEIVSEGMVRSCLRE